MAGWWHPTKLPLPATHPLAATGDMEMAELAREEMESLQAAIEVQGEHLKLLLLPKDPLDEKNIMLEVGGCSFTVLGDAC